MDEDALVHAALQGDRSAFERIVACYERPLYNVALRITRNREEARDVTQAAFLKAWLRLDQFDRSRRLFSWLYRIAINESLNQTRRQRPEVAMDEQMQDPGPSPQEGVEARERREQLEAAMAQLSRIAQEVLVLRHWLGLSYDDIADALGVPEKTVKSRLFSARTRLAELLRAQGVEAS